MHCFAEIIWHGFDINMKRQNNNCVSVMGPDGHQITSRR